MADLLRDDNRAVGDDAARAAHREEQVSDAQRHSPASATTKAFVVLVGLIFATLSLVTAATPAGASPYLYQPSHASHVSSPAGYANIRNVPTGGVVASPGNGTVIYMHCWTTGPNVYGTAKWFYVHIAGQPWGGYINANLVGNQAWTPRC